MRSKSRVGTKLAFALSLTSAFALGACGDDGPSGVGADAILGSWQTTSYVEGGVDLVNSGMDLDIALNSDGTYLLEVTNDQIEACGGGGVQSCQLSGSFSYTGSTVTIDDDQPADAVTFSYSISAGNFMTWTGTVDGMGVQITMQRR